MILFHLQGSVCSINSWSFSYCCYKSTGSDKAVRILSSCPAVVMKSQILSLLFNDNSLFVSLCWIMCYNKRNTCIVLYSHCMYA